jgi:hypothetical protein
MDQPARLLDSYRHADKAISGGGNDPAVQGRLAQAGALLAVAAATGRPVGARAAIQARLRRRRGPCTTARRDRRRGRRRSSAMIARQERGR